MIQITIITVCYNEKNKVRETIESVCQQTYSHMEYLIIDGGSTDGTVDVLREYSENKNIRFYSEKDFGIYNAMNRGIVRASGDYVFFINAGDTFFDEHVISNMVSYMKDMDVIYYGKVCVEYANGVKQILDFSEAEGTLEEKLLNGLMPCHQAIFAPRKLLNDHYFRERFKIRADYEWLMYSVSRGNRCKAVPVIVSYYDASGTSGRIKNNHLFYQEEEEIIREYQNDFRRDNTVVCTENMESGRKAEQLKYYYLFGLMNQWMALRQKGVSIGAYLWNKGYHRIAIYGMGALGLRLVEELKGYDIKVEYAVDRNAANICVDVRVISPEEILEDVDMMIVTAVTCFSEIVEFLRGKVCFPVVSLEDMISEADEQR
ncbi:MAG: glycosyltransferase [Lachnospiraceae bacterium]|nr:glycosyltransferase [Lachnospiraceae bacterium]